MKYTVRQIQKKLNELGFVGENGKQLDEDNELGPNTEFAIVEFKKSKGLAPRPYIGPITLEMLFGVATEDVAIQDQVPWLNELAKHMGMHEVHDNEALREWLKSDGAALGDPAKFPWCGDAIETAIRIALPKEWSHVKGALKKNPYWALNWAEFGVESKPALGAIAAFGRDGGGHVAILIGIDPERDVYRVRGGNQSNRVSDTWIKIERCVATRKPITWKPALAKLPIMNSKGQVVSKNER